MFSYHLTNAISFLLSLLPKKGLTLLAKAFAFLLFSILRLRRKLLVQNLDIVYGEQKTLAEKTKIASLAYYHFFLTCFEFLAERKGQLGDKVEIINRHYIDQAKQENKGVYILCIHMLCQFQMSFLP